MVDFVGYLDHITIDYSTGCPVISFRTEDKAVPEHMEQYKEQKLVVSTQKWRRRRSLDANAYFHTLCRKLAQKLKISEPECKNLMLRRYGQLVVTEENKLVDFIAKDSMSDDIDRWEKLHLMPTPDTQVMANGEIYRKFYLLKGSHELDSKEMSVLIDGLVEECKLQGIKTETPDVIEKMKQLWKYKEENDE